MKKNLSKILSLLLIAVMIFTFAACGSNDNSGDAEGPVSLSIATGGTSGTYYGYCGIIAQVFNQELGDTMNLSAVSTGASMANIQQMQVGASQIAIVQNDVMDYAYNAPAGLPVRRRCRPRMSRLSRCRSEVRRPDPCQPPRRCRRTQCLHLRSGWSWSSWRRR